MFQPETLNAWNLQTAVNHMGPELDLQCFAFIAPINYCIEVQSNMEPFNQ